MGRSRNFTTNWSCNGNGECQLFCEFNAIGGVDKRCVVLCIRLTAGADVVGC